MDLNHVNAGSEYRSPAQMKRVKTMSHYMTALAMQQKGLKPATKVVLYWLADHHNSETGLCFPSLGILAEECDLDRSTVIRHIAILEGKGLLMRVHRKRNNGSSTSNGYQLLLEKQPVAKYHPPRRKMRPPPRGKLRPP